MKIKNEIFIIEKGNEKYYIPKKSISYLKVFNKDLEKQDKENTFGYGKSEKTNSYLLDIYLVSHNKELLFSFNDEESRNSKLNEIYTLAEKEKEGE